MVLTEYVFWLGVVSICCLVAERITPWRPGQRLLRPQLAQDFFWLVLNGWAASLVLAVAYTWLGERLTGGFAAVFGLVPESMRFLSGLPLAAQAAVVLLVADFTEWCVHNLLHRVSWLWKFHRVHHSITVMDWIGNFRFHWIEIVVYKSVKYLPLAFLGAPWEAILIAAVISTAIGHLNHSNLNISWGPLRYVLNSPRMHIWHHEKELRGRAGVNFAIVFSMWDWIFGTAFMPPEEVQPEAIGFRGQERVAADLPSRFLIPFLDRPEPE